MFRQFPPQSRAVLLATARAKSVIARAISAAERTDLHMRSVLILI